MKKLSQSITLTLGLIFYFLQLNAQSPVRLGPGSGTSGNWSTYIGKNAGANSTVSNTFVGYVSGSSTTTGNHNTFIGRNSGALNITGANNVYLGYRTGEKNETGSDNIYIGRYAGRLKTIGSNELYIENTASRTPLIYGDFASDKVGINTKNTPSTIGGEDISFYSLFVEGGLLSEEVRVMCCWADYVFNENYKLLPLQQVEKYIAKNGHLPNVPSAKTVEVEGIELGDMTRIQQEKIEELTLYIIELNKRIENLEEKKAQSSK